MLLACGSLLAQPPAGTLTAPLPAAVRWKHELDRFDQQDRQSPPPKDPIVFVGSSSIRMWKLAVAFPGLPALNRGFGGSQLGDSAQLADRLVIRYQPKLVVLYAGDNDLAQGKSPQQVLHAFQEFVGKVRAALPSVPIVYLAIKPCLARWKLIDKVRAANALIREAAGKDPKLVFVDLEPTILGPDGKPRPELFLMDGLHLNAEGYKRLSELVKPYLTK
jgi:lysophospholipase L1-like esterase